MVCRITPIEKGHTLTEVLVAVAVSSILFMAMGNLALYGARSFAFLSTSTGLNQQSRFALEEFSADVRQADSVVSCTSNELTLNIRGAWITYGYDPSRKTFSRSDDRGNRVLLRNCQSVTFSAFQRGTIPGSFTEYAATSTNTCKMISIYWRCASDLFDQTSSVESGRTARVVLRRG